MHPAQQPILSPREVIRILVVHAKLWLVPAAALGILAAAYAVVHSPTWEASQALIVRNEATTGQEGLGQFGDTDEIKTIQETMLELVKSRGVLAAALAEVGPPADYKKDKAAWPAARDTVELRENLKLVPPKGAEFGKTEVLYLKVRSQDQARALALSTAVVKQLKARFQQLLDERAGSVITELEKAVALAEADLDESTGKLTQLETSVGVDLAELRILHESPADGSGLRREIVDVEYELRSARTDRRGKAELLALLEGALSNPSQVEALPSRLLESHAALSRLSEGLSAARLSTSGLLGKMSEAHPLVQAAKIQQREVLQDLNNELNNAVQIAKIELRLADARVESLEGQLADIRGRFDRLAGLRASYATQVAETDNRTALLQAARRSLADAHASRAAAQTASLIAQIDRPDTGTRPVGPSRGMIVLIGLAGGLLAGFGVLFLFVQPAQTLAAPPAEDEAIEEPHSVRPAAGGLTLKEALQKIVYGSTA
jgi:succinoglycan biosynthesis transport protein ExoP